MKSLSIFIAFSLLITFGQSCNHGCGECDTLYDTCSTCTCNACHHGWILTKQRNCIGYGTLYCPTYHGPSGNCTGCPLGYELTEYEDTGLATCTFGGCPSGYGLNTSSSESSCVACQTNVQDCTDCSDNYLSCASSQQEATGSQSPCLVTNCADCSEDISTCQVCPDGSSLYDYDGQTECVEICSNGYLYNSDDNECYGQCPEGYGADVDLWICAPCLVTNCTDCSADVYACQVCASGSSLYDYDGQTECVEICPNGYLYNPDNNECYPEAQCPEGFEPDLDLGICAIIEYEDEEYEEEENEENEEIEE